MPELTDSKKRVRGCSGREHRGEALKHQLIFNIVKSSIRKKILSLKVYSVLGSVLVTEDMGTELTSGSLPSATALSITAVRKE